MNLSKIFVLSLYGTICYSSLMLGLSEGMSDSFLNPQWLTIPFLLVSYRFTERDRQFALSQMWVNILGILSVSLAGMEYYNNQFGDDTTSGAFAGAHLLIFLTWIVLFQKKEIRQYWSLCVLSGLHVAVGAVLTTSGLFGFLMLVYLFVILWTLSVFTLYRSAVKFSHFSIEESLDAKIASRPSGNRVSRTSDEPLESNSKLSEGFGSVHLDRNDAWITSRFVGNVFNMTCLTMVVAALLFFLTPRVWVGSSGWGIQGTALKRSAISGFADEVQLGDFSRALVSKERVLQVKVFHNDSKEQIDVETYARSVGLDEPLFRGKVLDTYSNGRWKSVGTQGRTIDDLENDPGTDRFRQEFLLKPVGTNVLFAIPSQKVKKFRAGKISGTQTPIGINKLNSSLTAPQNQLHEKEFGYQIFDYNRKEEGDIKSAPQVEHSIKPGSEFVTLKRMTNEIVNNPTNPLNTDREKAIALTDYLKESGGFTYMLGAQIENRDIDPVEDFLNRKTGHCEFFASALVLMLREAGIPARMISGFKGGSVNRFSGYYEVEQRHAHVWVEAFMRTERSWIILDPTPASRDDGMASGNSSWHDFTNYVSYLWGRYVLSVSIEQQNEKIFNPAKKSIDDAMRVGKGKKHFMQLLSEFLSDRKSWTGWRGASLIFSMLGILVAIFFCVRAMIKAIKRQSQKGLSYAQRKRIIVEFYERFRAICEKMGLRREDSQTHLEFSESVRCQLQPILRQSHALAIPRTVTQAFYDIRFGEISLSDIQLDDIKSSVLRLEQAIADSDENGKKKFGTSHSYY